MTSLMGINLLICLALIAVKNKSGEEETAKKRLTTSFIITLLFIVISVFSLAGTAEYEAAQSDLGVYGTVGGFPFMFFFNSNFIFFFLKLIAIMFLIVFYARSFERLKWRKLGAERLIFGSAMPLLISFFTLLPAITGRTGIDITATVFFIVWFVVSAVWGLG